MLSYPRRFFFTLLSAATLVLGFTLQAQPGSAESDAPAALKQRYAEIEKRALAARQSGGREAAVKEFEAGLREVMKEFPDRHEPYGTLLQIAGLKPTEGARALYSELAAAPKAPEAVREQARLELENLGRVGKPLELAFTAVDGRKVDLARLRGKVVLIDFWATWCGPCVQEMPSVKAAYEKLHDKGFEIVGISFDQKRPALESFVKEEGIAWPQYFDGKGWKNDFGRRFGIRSIPTMWLVDKQGLLRDVEAREDLVGKVEKLLAE